ncbi:phosphoribosylaminoimidazolecarboxamide formyltransferase / IMP cyclohydrolase [Marinitoga hydrogenitolerans DSM 16785]|uniref:Bifunctional purine biosynthesis protein PurH n=1 Tax=Marinitoga hydrogenitolerans (strain DSM 16785 / JCM 12826 / AT1271) TaxID=1122195 RepID=A0A1M4YVG4_MARH1|nr:bifunctional phosphoribosylaminoimidazolecarboxamide formyltransferase/IMP cyclohydrolase [Marinitoga hydrogenitolerans]SHF09482.1 phosphoribosylaminoimidazolecarboxamide formyltransferase / IMP cyclohydrolase [Marinitoga hydrogenitolerans DSM 16785]
MKRALISTYYKNNIEKLVSVLIENRYEIISTGNTAKYLESQGFEVVKVEDVTEFPEILNGRVKTLHPKIHGGILARDIEEDRKTLKQLNIKKIDFVYVNLYPFEEKLKENLDIKELIEYIDIGGPTLIRAAAKSFENTIILTDPEDMDLIIKNIEDLNYEIRRYLAAKAFNLTAHYDSIISSYFNNLLKIEFPKYITLPLKKKSELRYGENPHQKAVYYENTTEEGFFSNFEQLNGKELSYNNFKDIDVAWKIVNEFEEKVCCAIKHQTPCGVASGRDNLEAFKRVYECDPISIFGGIVAFNHKVTAETAKEMKKIFLEVIIAPEFEEEAVNILKKKKNLRILKVKEKPHQKFEYVSVDGGVLVQERDTKLFKSLKIVTEEPIAEYLMEDMIFAFKVVKHAKSNAIVVSKEKMAKGIGSGQPNRIWAAIDALDRAKDGVVLASDAFFPFNDVVKKAGEYKIKAIIQPGGSIRDEDSIKVAKELGISMVFTNMRHFKH